MDQDKAGRSRDNSVACCPNREGANRIYPESTGRKWNGGAHPRGTITLHLGVQHTACRILEGFVIWLIGARYLWKGILKLLREILTTVSY